MKQVLVIGSVALDTISSPAGEKKEVLGGSATYFSISASFFTNVNLVATIGIDFPEEKKNLIKSFGVDLKGLETKNGKTFRWEGSYLEDLNSAKTIKTELNVFKDFKPNIPKEYRDTKYIFLANIDPDIQLFILNQFCDKIFIGCDSMNYWIQNKCKALKRLIGKTHIIFLNEMEARMFSGEDNIKKAGKFLLSLGPKFAVIKKGEHGAILFSDNFLYIAPAFLTDKVFDPTGAGDTFAGGFMGYLANKGKLDAETIKKALLYSTIMASFSVEDFSINRFLNLTKKDIETRYRNYRRMISL